jgi:hypothetical protein
MQLIVFAGLPGTGKSTLAETLGTTLATPVFALDWLLGALQPFAVLTPANAADVGMALLTTLVRRQLQLRQGAIVDHPTHTRLLREQWRTLAALEQIPVAFIEVICSDPQLHRQRLEGRTRHIPGWHEVTWSHVARMAAQYEPWDGERLVIDSVAPLAPNLQTVLTALGRLPPAAAVG